MFKFSEIFRRRRKIIQRGNKKCGVSLSIWRPTPGKLELTSLMGPDKKKKLLKKLPQFFDEFLPKNEVEKLCGTYEITYNQIN